MSPESVVAFGRQGLELLLVVVSPLLLVALVVGTVISILQAVTQVNESTLTFLPKLVALAVALVVLGPWMLTMLVDYLRRILGGLATLTA
ncbi:MAG: flagellar biosynthesis protein FliQ [Burkholderiaceae bacterium]|jgi:flagellar biosynthetic protein FliQ